MSDTNPSTPRVLLVDDDRSIQRLIAAFLAPLGLDLKIANCGAEALSMLRRQRPDLILLDHEMPGESGLEVLTRIREAPELHDVPVIFVTGSTSGDVISQCFERGANDYIQKPLRRPELIARVRSVLERQQMLGSLWRAARLDGLTGLPNRLLMQETLSASLEHVRQNEDHRFAVLFLDFDRFKLVNDSLGHDVGDMLLREISQRLRENLRTSDAISRDGAGTTLSRIGGDEFVVLLDDIADLAAAEAVAQRLLGVLNEPYQIGKHTISSTASIGVVCSHSGYTAADEMLRDADIAMYEAKNRGKGCFVTFDPAMQQAVIERHEIERDLRCAVGTDQIHLAYQPIFSLEDGTVHGVEALARWDHPTKGSIQPDVFIPIAEETQLIVPLGEIILDEACRQLSEWLASGHDSIEYISVNVSRAQLKSTDFARQVVGVVRRHGLQTRQLQLEVTESMIMERPDAAVELLDELRAAGVRLAMDDFGTGYSSLSCLHRFPFDVIKIDRSFVSKLNTERTEFVSLIHAIVNLAYNLGMECVAEGVESREQIAVLLTVDCMLGQGYLLGEPARANSALMDKWRQGLAEKAMLCA